MIDSANDNRTGSGASGQPNRSTENELAELRADLLERTRYRSLAAFETAFAEPEPRRFDLMVTALASKNPVVGAKAAEALEAYGERAIVPLVGAVDTAHTLVQLAIVQALDVIGSPQAVQPLVTLLKDAEGELMRCTIIAALGNLGDSSLIDLLRPYLDDENGHVRARTEVVLLKLSP